MKRLLLPCLLLLSSASHAEILGLKIGVNAWETEVSGGIDFPDVGLLNSALDLDLERDYVLDKENQFTGYIQWDHPIPYLPKIRGSIADISHTGTLRPSSRNNFSTDEGKLDLTHLDITAYYTVFDTLVDIDIGITARQFDGELRAKLGDANAASDIDSTLALLFTRATIDIPITGLSFGIEASGGDTKIIDLGTSGETKGTDISAYIEYASPFGLGIAAGYRKFETEIEAKAIGTGGINADITMDMELEGPFASLFIAF